MQDGGSKSASAARHHRRRRFWPASLRAPDGGRVADNNGASRGTTGRPGPEKGANSTSGIAERTVIAPRENRRRATQQSQAGKTDRQCFSSGKRGQRRSKSRRSKKRDGCVAD